MPDAAKAKSVIFLFMAGGPSHIETFDPKPLLNKLNGQKRPKEFGEAKRQFIKGEPKLLGHQADFQTARQERAVGVRPAAAYGARAPTIWR